jgi:hypothetical protein
MTEVRIMQLFHTLVFDDAIEGTTAVYSDSPFNAELATADKFQIMGVVSQVSVSAGTPTITVQLEHSANNRNFVNKSGTAEINATTLSTTAITVVTGNDAGSVPFGGFLRLRITLGGTSPKARVRLWVTGRSA